MKILDIEIKSDTAKVSMLVKATPAIATVQTIHLHIVIAELEAIKVLMNENTPKLISTSASAKG